MVAANGIPSDLFFEIFSKLPVKSLLRFKSLSKTFDSLIRNPSFISKHLTSQSESVSLFQRSDDPKCDLGLCSLYSPYQVQEPVSSKLDQEDGLAYQHVGDYKVPIAGNLGQIMSVACCRGLVCLASKQMNRTKRLFLWNPATRTTKLIYEAPNRPVRDEWCQHRRILYGFGYDSRANDCKFARLTTSGQFQVYSVNSSTWGSVMDVGLRLRCKILCYSMVSSVNGHLYWLLRFQSSSYKFAIHSYNFSDDSVGEIALPEACKGGMFKSITELEGNLCLLVAYSEPGGVSPYCQRKDVDLWMMKEEGTTDKVSWIKSFTVSPPLRYVDQVITWKGFIVYSFLRNSKMCFSIVGSWEPSRSLIFQGISMSRPLPYRETLMPV